MCGDDFEISYSELLRELKKEDVDKILNDNRNTDFLKLDNLISIEYLEIVDPTTFTSINILGKKNLLVIAVHIGKARLIDNIILNT